MLILLMKAVNSWSKAKPWGKGYLFYIADPIRYTSR